MKTAANQAAAANAPVASWFGFGHDWRRVTEQRRWLMRRVLFTTLTALWVSGCTPSGTQHVTAKSNESQRSQELDKKELEASFNRCEDVFLWETTPYDSDPLARQVYLECFFRHYRLGVEGIERTSCIVLDIPHRRAVAEGHDDGQLAGSLVWMRSHLRLAEGMALVKIYDGPFSRMLDSDMIKQLCQPGGAANGSRPFRVETNTAPSAAGSRR